MKKYKVNIVTHVPHFGTIEVEANSPKEAGDKAVELMEDDWNESWKDKDHGVKI